jgi:protein involved in polysaccharide export with SLBB domain
MQSRRGMLRVVNSRLAGMRFKITFFHLLPIAALLLSPAALFSQSSTSPSDISRQMLNPSTAAPAPPPPAASAAAATNITGAINAPSGYVLSPNDQVAVEVFGEEDLRTNSRLNGEGNLSLPLLGSVKLAGMTLTQATAKLTELYGRDYLVNPKVNVSLVGYAKRRFTILGQVNRPGSYEMPETSPGGVDLLEAIAIAGGYTRIAAPERISIRRNDKLMKVDAKRLGKGEGSFRVESGDTITVGESIF